jgi:hypothetical protein
MTTRIRTASRWRSGDAFGIADPQTWSVVVRLASTGLPRRPTAGSPFALGNSDVTAPRLRRNVETLAAEAVLARPWPYVR